LIGTAAGASLNHDTDNDGAVFIGYNAGYSYVSGGGGGVFIGFKAGQMADAAVTNAVENTYIGYEAGRFLDDGTNNVALGYRAMRSADADGQNAIHSVAIGFEALYQITDGDYNIAVGSRALQSHKTGNRNIAIGWEAMHDTNAGSTAEGSNDNVFMGYQAGGGTWADVASESNVGIGNYVMNGVLDGALKNTAVGYNALSNVTTGDSNTALGNTAGQNVTTATLNVYIGDAAGLATTSGGSNVAIGTNAYRTGNAGTNVAIGSEAARYTTSNDGVWIGANANKLGTGGGGGTIVGHYAGYVAQGTGMTHVGQGAGRHMSGSYNVFVGHDAGLGGTTSAPYGTGINNVGIGTDSLRSITTGDRNTALGEGSGDNITTGDFNTYIGAYARASAADVNDEIVLKAGTDALAGGGTETVRIGVDSDYIVNDFGENASWSHSSDRRIKKDIEDNELGLDFISKLKTRNFKKKAPSEYPSEFEQYDEDTVERKNPDRKHYGFVAQEVKEVMDEVGHSEFPMWSEQKDGMQLLAESELITPLVKAVQELSEIVKSQQKEIEELKKK
jgi:hypothetical protein